MTPTSPDDLLERIRDHHTTASRLDVDDLIRRGHHRRRRGQLAGISATAILLAGVVAVAFVVRIADHSPTTATVHAASAPSTSRGLVARQPADGQVETLATVASGWQAAAYVDTAGDMCEGWINPATSVMQGACGAALLAGGPTTAQPGSLVSPLLIEPEAAVGTQSVDAFGITGPNTASVAVMNHGKPLKVMMSNLRSSTGQRAFLVEYPFPHVTDWVDFATARDASGGVVGRTQFVAPDTGTPAGPQPKPTP